MLEVFNKVFRKDSGASKEIAKERLRLVLVHDRATVSPRFLELIREDIVDVIVNYMEIDEGGMEISLDSLEDAAVLVASIPVKRVKRVARPTG